VECIYKLHESKILKARGLQIITKTLTILKLWKCVGYSSDRGTVGAQCAECAENRSVWVHTQCAENKKPFGCTVH
jgi:hypothetical protein